MMMMGDINARSGKVVLIGDGACGKTCLLEVFKINKFPKEYIPTVVDNFFKVVEFKKDKKVTLALWDTAGQDDYDTIRPLSYRETDVVFICYTIENRKNMPNLEKKWLLEIKNYCPNAIFFLVALKKDLRFDAEIDQDTLVTTEEGKAMAKKIKAEKFFECSALTREKVDEVFNAAAEHIYCARETENPKNTCCNLINHLEIDEHRKALYDGVSLYLENGKILNPSTTLMPTKVVLRKEKEEKVSPLPDKVAERVQEERRVNQLKVSMEMNGRWDS
ncbi:ras-like GTP-binding protein Rho1 [Arctopsyche grandis]|uniref:ras-like GTP-binding protein Rho1 n=1 Tax=Arctopsyche grandis TaxID=121162 RepID=UPI00406D93FF